MKARRWHVVAAVVAAVVITVLAALAGIALRVALDGLGD